MKRAILQDIVNYFMQAVPSATASDEWWLA